MIFPKSYLLLLLSKELLIAKPKPNVRERLRVCVSFCPSASFWVFLHNRSGAKTARLLGNRLQTKSTNEHANDRLRQNQFKRINHMVAIVSVNKHR